MSLTSALSNARSGLSAATRSAELISSNVANALTEGYGRREIRLSSAVVGGAGHGVHVDGVERVVNQSAINSRRYADAEFASAQTKADFYRSLETVLGTPENTSSLASRISKLQAELVTAAVAPESNAQLGSVVSAAKDLAQVIRSASSNIQDARQTADGQISIQVQLLNENLSSVATINNQIQIMTLSGGDASGLIDQRQQLIDEISDLVPIRELPKENGRIALATPNGTVLVDDTAAEFGFTATPTIVPEMSLSSSALSGLTLSGAASSAGSAIEAINGGAIAANFEMRDEIAPDAQKRLDDLAADLISRTANVSADTTIGSGPGLFTDDNAMLDVSALTGLGSRLFVNEAVDPDAGGNVWRIRDGVAATAIGSVGNIAILSGLADALSGDVDTGNSVSFANAAAEFSSFVGTARSTSETQEGFAISQLTVFQDAERTAGVDTDQEMQKLLAVEQSYAANAKLIETIDEMMQSLLRI